VAQVFARAGENPDALNDGAIAVFCSVNRLVEIKCLAISGREIFKTVVVGNGDAILEHDGIVSTVIAGANL